MADQHKLVSSQLSNLYRKTLEDSDSYENNEKLKSKTRNLLIGVNISQRHNKMTLEVIQSSIETMQNFEALNAANGFKILETFARNLLRSPWKEGYKKIKVILFSLFWYYFICSFF